jgi:hypothetical protein
MKTFNTNTIGVVIAILLFLILIVLVSGFGLWKEVISTLGVVVTGFVLILILFYIIKFLRSAFQLTSFAFTHTSKGEPRENIRWTTALRSLYKHHRGFFFVSIVSLLLLLFALGKYIVTGRWG